MAVTMTFPGPFFTVLKKSPHMRSEVSVDSQSDNDRSSKSLSCNCISKSNDVYALCKTALNIVGNSYNLKLSIREIQMSLHKRNFYNTDELCYWNIIFVDVLKRLFAGVLLYYFPSCVFVGFFWWLI